MTTRSRALAALFAIVLIAIIGAVFWVAYEKHRDNQFQSQVQPLVRKATARLQATLELARSENITWKESFERSESHIADIEKLALDARSMAPQGGRQVTLVRAAEDYMGASQSLIRAQLSFARAQFRLTVARKSYSEAIDEKGYSYDFWKSQLERTRDALEKARNEANHALNHYIVTTTATQKAVAAAAPILGSEDVVAASLLDAHKVLLEKVAPAKDLS